MIAKLDKLAKKLSEQRQKIADEYSALEESTKRQSAELDQRQRGVNARIVRVQEARSGLVNLNT